MVHHDPIEEPFDFRVIKDHVDKLRFRSSPGGFLIVQENANQESDKENSGPAPTFLVEDHHNCHQWEDVVHTLKDRCGPLFVILDITYTKIEGGNKRLLVMLEWQPSGTSYTVARAICNKFAIMFQWLANTEEDLDINKIKDFVSKGAAIGTK